MRAPLKFLRPPPLFRELPPCGRELPKRRGPLPLAPYERAGTDELREPLYEREGALERLPLPPMYERALDPDVLRDPLCGRALRDPDEEEPRGLFP